MTKEKELEKIIRVHERIAMHIIMDYEYRLKKNREAFEEDLNKNDTEEGRSHAVDYAKNENAIKYYSASDQLDSIYLFARYMMEALNIKDPEDKVRNILIKKEMETKDKLLSKSFDEEAELEKYK